MGKYSELSLTETGRKVAEGLIRPLYEVLVPETDMSHIKDEIAVLEDHAEAQRYATECFRIY